MSIHVIISILILVVGLILGMPIPFAFGASFLYLTYTLHFNPSTLLASGYTQINSAILLAIPFFVTGFLCPFLPYPGVLVRVGLKLGAVDIQMLHINVFRLPNERKKENDS